MGAVAIDLDDLVVHAPDRQRPLTRLEGDLLAHLAAHRGRYVPREELLTAVWRYHPRVLSRAVDHAVWRIRRKVERDPSAPRWITSRRGRGYRLEAEQAEPSAAPLTLLGDGPRARIARAACAELGLDVVWARGEGDAPFPSGPVLLDGAQTVWGAENVCRYLAERCGRDPLGVTAMDWRDRNVLAVIDDALDAAGGALAWLEREAAGPGLRASAYVEIGLAVLWDELCRSGRAAPSEVPRLAALAVALAARPSVADAIRSAPSERCET